MAKAFRQQREEIIENVYNGAHTDPAGADADRIENLIDRKLLGYITFGFVDIEQWRSFMDAYFTRPGITEGEPYTSKINQNLSGAAMLQTLDELRKRLKQSPLSTSTVVPDRDS